MSSHMAIPLVTVPLFLSMPNFIKAQKGCELSRLHDQLPTLVWEISALPRVIRDFFVVVVVVEMLSISFCT